MIRFRLKLAYFDAKCSMLRWQRKWQNRFSRAVTPTFLFILCPAYCGSTLLHEILSSSPSVSPNNLFGTREGQSLPQVRRLIDYRKRWELSYVYPWEAIKKEWMAYWAHSKPLLLDKSPPNLLRASALQRHFQPAVFIAMLRNPYVHCEAMMRRDGMIASDAAKRAVLCLDHQKKNLESIDRIILVKYEELVRQPESVRQRILTFLPLLQTLKMERRFKAHSAYNKPMPIVDMNAGKLECLLPEQLKDINQVFKPNSDLLQCFGYQLNDQVV